MLQYIVTFALAQHVQLCNYHKHEHRTLFDFVVNNIHEKITHFWLVKMNAVLR